MTLKTRKPTGKVAPPLILLEGGEKSGKSWSAAELSASPKIGQTYWIDLGEGAADEYGAIPGARYEIVEHDGTFTSLLAAVVEIRDLAKEAGERGEPPVALIIDSMTQEWELLKDWAYMRAKRSDTNKKRLEEDPDAEIDISQNYWNDANNRHRRLMTKLMTFQNGIVVMIARGKDTVAVENGKPNPRKKAYSVEGQKNLGFDASAWVRMSREAPPRIVGLRSVFGGLKPGVAKPEPHPDLTLEWLIFERLRYDPQSAAVRQLSAPMDPELIRDEALSRDVTVPRLQELWRSARDADQLTEPTTDADGGDTTLGALLAARAKSQMAKAAGESKLTAV